MNVTCWGGLLKGAGKNNSNQPLFCGVQGGHIAAHPHKSGKPAHMANIDRYPALIFVFLSLQTSCAIF